MLSYYTNRYGRTVQRKVEIYKDLEALAWEMNSAVDAAVVEGMHDRITLKALGFKMPILSLSCGCSFNQIVEEVMGRFEKVAILTDFDEEGEKVNRRLTGMMECRGVKVDRFYRRSFRKLMKEVGLTTLESIHKLKREVFS
ncbi:MAG: toprim domain-containing protein [Candidatus Bathyarchaeia archaeon]